VIEDRFDLDGEKIEIHKLSLMKWKEMIKVKPFYSLMMQKPLPKGSAQ